MNEEEAEDVRITVENEGFDYAFRSKTDFVHIKDARFHELRMAYLAAAKALADYIGADDA